MTNGATMRICEHRELAYQEDELFQMETFRVFGTKGTFRERRWAERERWAGLTVEEMRDRLPADVEAAFRGALGTDPYGGHGGSHAFLVHEFVSAIAAGRGRDQRVGSGPVHGRGVRGRALGPARRRAGGRAGLGRRTG